MIDLKSIKKSQYWADLWASKIIGTRGEKNIYTCASGITPSGTVHIGNFREIISVDLVVRALRQRGKTVRFLYSWDDYDVFRKVPPNIPQSNLLETYLRQPVDGVPDTSGQGYESYAQAHEKVIEQILPLIGITPEYIYQATRYRSSTYAKEIRCALEHREIIIQQLNKQRKNPLPNDWFPVLIFCEQCHRDTTTRKVWDKEWSISYFCEQCYNTSSIDLRNTGVAKLPWRIDWPMRWAYENVDFEPAGKDHHSDGGSFSTAEKIVTEVYKKSPPLSFQYDFIRIKGGSGKISSSEGNVITLEDCLSVYQPEVLRFIFAGTRPNREFAISFDLDVLKNYEDYDRLENLYYTSPNNKSVIDKDFQKWIISARIYELSQVNEPPTEKPYQVSMRHLCTLLQIHEGNIDATIAHFNIKPGQKEDLRVRCRCAWTWICHYAPEDFRFSLRRDNDGSLSFTQNQQNVIREAYDLIPLINNLNQDEFATHLYTIATKLNIKNSFLFSTLYLTLLGKEKGPRLVSFLYTIGTERLILLFQKQLRS